MRFRHFLPLPLLAALLCTLPAAAADASPPTDKLNKKIDNVTFTDAAGRTTSLYDLKDKKAVVVLFLSFECPVSLSYSQMLADLARAYADRGVSFVGVCGQDDLDAAGVARQAAECKLAFPVYKDDKSTIADAFKAAVNPEAFVLDHNFVLRYRGRIDDAWAARLKKNQQVTRSDLKAALDELLAGKDVSVPATTAIGCALRRAHAVKADGPVTYHRDVLPILQERCQSCHRPGEVGPFSLLTYKQAVNWAGDIKDYTQDRRMPPWKPSEGPAFHNERKLTDKEIATLAKWVEGGTPEGDPKDAPPPKEFPQGWQLGKPDLVLEAAEEVTIGPSGRDMFRCLVFPTNFDEDKYVVALEVRPGNPRVVHHTLQFIDTTGAGRKLEQKEKDRKKDDNEQDRGPGYSVAMGVGFTPQGTLGGWAPGQMARHLPKGTGYLLPKGADVVMQVHYHRNGRVEKDKVQLGLYFAKGPIEKRFQNMVIAGGPRGPLGPLGLIIPKDDPNYHVIGGIRVEIDCVLHSVMPHMHLLGKSIKVTLTPPEGKPTTLVAIKEWDYNWQETYFFQEPIAVKAGTIIEVDAWYDNSASNPNNPNNPPKPVFFGEQTTNEMCFVFLGCTADQPVRGKFKQGVRVSDDKKP